MTLVVNRARDAGRWIDWRLGDAVNLPGMPKGSKCYISDESHCTVIVSYTPKFGWHISIAHPYRHPTWNEIASARYQLVPDNFTMVMVLPPEEEYVNVHEHCFHLHECRCPR